MRQVKWSSSSNDSGLYTCKTENYWRTSVKLRLRLELGITGNVKSRNPILTVMRDIPNSRKKEILFSREFVSTYAAKEAVDAMLTLCDIYHGRHNPEAESYFIELLSRYKGAELPEQPIIEFNNNNKIYSYTR